MSWLLPALLWSTKLNSERLFRNVAVNAVLVDLFQPNRQAYRLNRRRDGFHELPLRSRVGRFALSMTRNQTCSASAGSRPLKKMFS